MREALLEWLTRSEGPLAYVALGVASLLEYVFPPFPGDSITVLGVVLAAGAGYSLAWVYVALNLGALLGGMAAYGFGRLIAEQRLTKSPRFLRGQQVRRAIDTVLARFERHGVAYLAINRFVPALRSVFFVAAGMARLPAWKVALFGTASAMLWNGLLLGAGWAVGANYDRLAAWVRTYTYAAIGVVALIAIVVVVRVVRARRARSDAP